MANPAGQLIPKSRLAGADRKMEMELARPAVLSGASGANSLLGSLGMRTIPGCIHHLEYKFDETLSGTPTLYVGVRRTGGGLGDELQDVIDDPAGEFQVVLAAELLDVSDANVLQSVDLSSFTDDERTLLEGDELIAVIKGTGGAWACNHIAVKALGLEIPTSSV